MILSESKGGQFIFQFDPTEFELFAELLKQYPLVEPSHFELSKSADPDEIADDQQFLEETLSSEKRQTRRELHALLEDESRRKTTEEDVFLRISAEEGEWLLQVINDLRIGSWIGLGCPDEKQENQLELTPEIAPLFWTIRFAGYCQSVLLDALNEELL